MLKSIALSSFAITGTLLFGAFGLSHAGFASPGEMSLMQCGGSRAQTLTCCETAHKPLWWRQAGASCHVVVSCSKGREAGSAANVKCRIIRPNDITHGRDIASNGGKSPGGGSPNQGGRKP
jgi:hypothetical protein